MTKVYSDNLETRRSVWVELDDRGIEVSQQDLGPAAALVTGRPELERGVRIPASALPLLAAKLLAEKLEGNADAVTAARELCEQLEIPHDAWVW
jgi:hypothetical protein